MDKKIKITFEVALGEFDRVEREARETTSGNVNVADVLVACLHDLFDAPVKIIEIERTK